MAQQLQPDQRPRGSCEAQVAQLHHRASSFSFSLGSPSSDSPFFFYHKSKHYHAVRSSSACNWVPPFCESGGHPLSTLLIALLDFANKPAQPVTSAGAAKASLGHRIVGGSSAWLRDLEQLENMSDNEQKFFPHNRNQ